MRRSPLVPMNTLAARLVLAVLLLFAQQQAATHWLSHAGSAKASADAKHAAAGNGSSPAEHCDECLALSALGGAAPSTAPVLPHGSAQHAVATAPVATTTPAVPRRAFEPRAPPVLS